MHKIVIFVILISFLSPSLNLVHAKTTESKVSKKSYKTTKKKKKKKKTKKKRNKKKSKRRYKKKKSRKKVKQESIVDDTHSSLSKQIFLLTNSVDNFLGGDDADDNANSSRIRLISTGQQREGEEPTSEFDVNMNLVLPQFQKRLNDTLQSILRQDDDKEEDSNRKKSDKSKKQQVKNKTTNGKENQPGLLQAIYEESRSWRVNIQTGVNVDWPPQMYIRMKMFKNYFFTKWQMKPSQEITWLDRQGWSTRTRLIFDKRLAEKLVYRWNNQMTWAEKAENLGFSNGPSLLHQIDGWKAMYYNLRINSFNNVISHQISSYVANIVYRQRLYKKWLFMSIIPQQEFALANNFVKDPSLTIKFEAVFGSI
jgi:hypothetical protein